MPDLQIAVTKAEAAVLPSEMSVTTGAPHIQVNESLEYISEAVPQDSLLTVRLERKALRRTKA